MRQKKPGWEASRPGRCPAVRGRRDRSWFTGYSPMVISVLSRTIWNEALRLRLRAR